jgi:hypothetical protein
MKKKVFNIDFIGIGAEKAGTSWLAEMLKVHPQICLSEPKEIHFFNYRQPYIWRAINPHYKKNLDWYARHFKHCHPGAIKGEFSTFYLFDKEAPRKIASVFPDVSLLVCLRDPVERAISQYRMYRDRYSAETKSFEDSIKRHAEYLEKGLYYEQINRYLSYFPMEKIQIVFFDDIKSRPLEVLQNIYKAVGADHDFIPVQFKHKQNPAVRTRNPYIFKLMTIYRRLSQKFGLTSLTNHLKKLGLKDLIMKLNSSSDFEPIDCDKKKLARFFQADIEALEKLLGRDLNHWKP